MGNLTIYRQLSQMSYNIIIYARHDEYPLNIKQTKSKVKDKDQNVVIQIDDTNASKLANPIISYIVKISRKIADKKDSRNICLDVEFKLKNSDHLALAAIDSKNGPTEAQIIIIQNIVKKLSVKSSKCFTCEFWTKKNTTYNI